jgi:lipid II:glycine glycyltransferase (peptidoglycan interpeptide bridge formation enzyme)
MNTISLFYQNSSKNFSKIIGEEKKLMELLADFFDQLPFHIITIFFPSEYIDMQPFIWKNFKVVPYYTYIIDLTNSITEIEAKFAPERRNEIKKAILDGVSCRNENRPDIVKQMVLNTFSRKEKNINSKFFDKILFDFPNSENCVTFISYQDEKPIAVVFCIYDEEKMYYLLGGYDYKYKHQGAGALALYSAIKYAKGIGIQSFDFEGSMLPEIEKYFRGFGGELTPYFSANKAKLPLEIILKFFKRSVF